jgi:Short-chain alcohol dehydrogenase of unknown specificity
MAHVWLITGSARGLGRAIAEGVLAAGDKLIATARNPQQLSDLVERYGENVRAVALDVTDERAAIAAVQLAVDVVRPPRCVGQQRRLWEPAAIEDTTIQDFRAQLETNLFGVVNLTKAAIPVMRRQGAGRILQFSSMGGRVGPIGRGAYAAAKWGVEGFSEVLAKEVGPLGIKVTIIEPGGLPHGLRGILPNHSRGQSRLCLDGRSRRAVSARVRWRAARRPEEGGGGRPAHRASR